MVKDAGQPENKVEDKLNGINQQCFNVAENQRIT